MADDYELDSLELRLKRVSLPIGLVLDEVLISGKGARVSTDPFAVHLDEPGRVVVKIHEGSIERFLERLQLGGASDFSVQATGGRLHIQTSVRVLVEIRVNVLCSLESEGGKRLDIVIEDGEPAAAKRMLESQIDKINPILDLSELPLDMTIEEIVIDEGWVELRGTVQPVA